MPEVFTYSGIIDHVIPHPVMREFLGSRIIMNIPNLVITQFTTSPDIIKIPSCDDKVPYNFRHNTIGTQDW